MAKDKKRKGGGASKSPYPLGERRLRAKDLFVQGYTTTEVAEKLEISVDTAGRYRALYEAEIQQQAAANPDLLNQYLENTVRLLAENDLARSRAWDTVENAHSQSIKIQALNTVSKLQGERAKLFGLLGVKQDYFAHVQRVHLAQQKLLEFMQKELCDRDREKLAEYITTDILGAMGADAMSLPAEAIDTTAIPA